MNTPRVLLAAALVALLAGCTASGTSARQFDLAPNDIGWYAGDEAAFTLSLNPGMLNREPTYTLDRRFAIEEVRLEERAPTFGGDYATREPDDLALRILRDGQDAEAFPLDATNASVEIRLTLPDELRDSQYALELRLFKVGWVKSEVFRVDRR